MAGSDTAVMGVARKINVLLGCEPTINTDGLYSPLKRFKSELNEEGLDIHFYDALTDKILECDTLVLDSKYFKNGWQNSRQRNIDQIAQVSDEVADVLWFNTADSTAGVQRDVLPFVRRYIKAQAYKDRSEYKRKHYGGRLFTDYYHKKAGIVDSEPMFSKPVMDDADLRKIVVGWNYGLAGGFNRLWDPLRFANRLVPKIGIPLMRSMGRTDSYFEGVKRERPISVFAHMNTAYSRETVSHQRKEALSKVSSLSTYQVVTGVCSRSSYFHRLRRSLCALSPFGWGEINVRDFEVFAAGAALVKPDISHVDTFPDYFIQNKTYVSYNWDAMDLLEKIEGLIADMNLREEIAENAQKRFGFFEKSQDGKKIIIEHIKKVFLGETDE